MELRKTLSTLALGGAALVAIAGAASAREYERWEHRDYRVGPFVEFNVPGVPYRTAYHDGCGFYRMKWHQTGRRYWLRRLEQCRYDRG